MQGSTLNTPTTELIKLARYFVDKKAASEKASFVDPATAAGGGAPPGGAPQGGDPAAMGMDPSMMGMDPSMMGGGAPPAPAPDAGGGGGGGGDMTALLAKMDQMMTMVGQGGGAGGGGAGGAGLKPKIDQNVVSMQILKILARVADALGVSIPASEMVVTGPDLNQMAATQQQQQAAPAQQSAISPIQPMQGASPALAQGGGGGGGSTKSSIDQGRPYKFDFQQTADKAAAVARAMRLRS
jgi:hypothetical protein